MLTNIVYNFTFLVEGNPLREKKNNLRNVDRQIKQGINSFHNVGKIQQKQQKQPIQQKQPKQIDIPNNLLGIDEYNFCKKYSSINFVDGSPRFILSIVNFNVYEFSKFIDIFQIKFGYSPDIMLNSNKIEFRNKFDLFKFTAVICKNTYIGPIIEYAKGAIPKKIATSGWINEFGRFLWSSENEQNFSSDDSKRIYDSFISYYDNIKISINENFNIIFNCDSLKELENAIDIYLTIRDRMNNFYINELGRRVKEKLLDHIELINIPFDYIKSCIKFGSKHPYYILDYPIFDNPALIPNINIKLNPHSIIFKGPRYQVIEAKEHLEKIINLIKNKTPNQSRSNNPTRFVAPRENLYEKIKYQPSQIESIIQMHEIQEESNIDEDIKFKKNDNHQIKGPGARDTKRVSKNHKAQDDIKKSNTNNKVDLNNSTFVGRIKQGYGDSRYEIEPVQFDSYVNEFEIDPKKTYHASRRGRLSSTKLNVNDFVLIQVTDLQGNYNRSKNDIIDRRLLIIIGKFKSNVLFNNIDLEDDNNDYGFDFDDDVNVNIDEI